MIRIPKRKADKGGRRGAVAMDAEPEFASEVP